MAVDRSLLRNALQQNLAQSQGISQRAMTGQGFDPRGGSSVALAQLLSAGIGAFAQNRAKKQIAEEANRAESLEDARLASALASKERIAQLSSDKSQFSIQKTDQGLIRVNPQTGEAFPVTSQDGKRVGVPKPKAAEGKKPLSGESTKLLTIATGGIKSLNKLHSFLNEEGEDGTISVRSDLAPERLKTPRGRQMTLLRKDLADSIGRLRSGGAINEKEEGTFLGFVPSRTDDAETVKFKMKKLGEKFVTIQSGITGQEIPQAELNLGKQSAPQQSFAPDAIQAEMARRGLK